VWLGVRVSEECAGVCLRVCCSGQPSPVGHAGLVEHHEVDLPRGAAKMNFMHNPNITGNVKDMPRGATVTFFGYGTQITGELKDLPQRATGFIGVPPFLITA